MTFVLLFSAGWLLILGAIGLNLWRRRRATDPAQISDHWLAQHNYKRTGDLPPGTARQEEQR